MLGISKRFSWVSEKLLILAFGMASALAFPALLAYTRYFDVEAVPYIIFMQASTAFGAFIIQAGLRAGLRKEFVEGRIRVVDSATFTFVKLIIKYGWLISFISIFIVDAEYTFLPLLAGSNAVFTMLIGLSSLKENRRLVLIFSLLLLLLNMVAGILEITFDHDFLHYVLIELVSMAMLITVKVALWPKLRSGSNVLLRKVATKYIGLQVTSFFIMGCVYCLSMSIVLISKEQPWLALLYADVTIISNIAILLFARSSLVFERDILSGRVNSYLLFLFLFFLLFSVFMAFIKPEEQQYITFFLTLSFVGQFTLSSLSQYSLESERRIFVLLSGLMFGYYLFIIALEKVSVSLLVVNLYFVSLVIYLHLVKSKFGGFINAK
ncbi:hypothetical protein NI389_07270 [Pseudoalteromonas xiamenensis]|uniref:hypothetical protein n=1 Tax=Pseudoalteromonas xiamenensis TaxID=882626 RepID=UPI0027E452AA|nr:hypothetical protein [Pseudoalteromonas xiamenensis]WMN61177.1 hypothetical protein NI389_07270 [Pseudoalteromonas xiamenensis]